MIDEDTRESLAALVVTSISRRRTARDLTVLIERRGMAGVIVRENGTDVTSRAILCNSERPRSALGCQEPQALPPHSPHRAISFAHRKRCADHPLRHRRNGAKFCCRL